MLYLCGQKTIMEINESFRLSMRFHEMLKSDLSHAFSGYLPVEQIEEKARSIKRNGRDRIFTPVNTVLTMLLTSLQEDKSLQNGLNLFKQVFESNCTIILQEEELELSTQRINDRRFPRKPGRPRKYKSRIPKSFKKPLSESTAGYSTARKNLDAGIIEDVFRHSTDVGEHDKESWHGMKTYITDGTYLQLQDTADIRSEYVVKGQESSYPQALLQVLIRQGSGQVSQSALGTRRESELQLVIPMIKNLESNSLLLADDLYCTYYHFCQVLAQNSHLIVPGKRDRNYKVISKLNDNDQIVELSKTSRPEYVSKEEWDSRPQPILMRRITNNYPTKNGMEAAILYTTILDEHIKTSDIITKYTMRWDIEISIREIKTLMDINVLRSQSREMMKKELLIALSAYNMVRRKIAESADKAGFSPQDDFFQKCPPISRTILLDKRGRVFYKWSPGRYGYVENANKQTPNTASKREKTALSKKN
jgi:hypothetical protein